MGRINYYGYPSDNVEPPEPDYDITIECPNCGAELHEGEKVYELTKDGYRKRFACEYCIEDFSTFVEDL